MGLRKMAEATDTHDYWQLSRLARWHVEREAMNQALAMLVAAQGKLPMSRLCVNQLARLTLIRPRLTK
ncbi:hypothetical protein GCM10007874_45500 [Labrys miyagiensis]|uniref:Tn3 transposase DDE domain-containing protein n=1 Tax=Labrys miyagiensis TaxID=346912 RepID=A0ABQ6CP41_9HYPH|nr:hypothetical protein GCM10007874_45500 [Labrys miyagiensis]